jgi:hypothetical protein
VRVTAVAVLGAMGVDAVAVRPVVSRLFGLLVLVIDHRFGSCDRGPRGLRLRRRRQKKPGQERQAPRDSTIFHMGILSVSGASEHVWCRSKF